MFLSADYLAVHYGVDDKIAKFFVDRDPPAGNLYWHEKLLYLRFEPGYLFIPLIVDLLFKLGISREHLLSEDFVQLMEKVGHIGALEETKKLSVQQAVEECAKITIPVAKDHHFVTELGKYFNNEPNQLSSLRTGISALHRGDLFLFCIAALPVYGGIYQQVVQTWFALISSLLLLDDAQDVEQDSLNGEANAFIETGFDDEGLEQVKGLVKHNLQLISKLNSMMAKTLDSQLVNMFNKPYFQQRYNQQ
jgi:hypothetical protein